MVNPPQTTVAVLPDYRQFDGHHYDTGPIRNALAYQGVKAPHTGKPLSETLLFGISGGIVAAYFTFDWHGQDPWFHFLTRISFDPMQRLIERLALPTDVKHTDNPDKAVKNLTDALQAGKPAIVWADIGSMTYSGYMTTGDDWFMLPMLAFGYDGQHAHLADRARVPILVPAGEFAAARARVKKEKHRVMTLGAPDLSQLPQAVEAGIRACVAHFTEPAPIKPLQGKFGFDAYTRWANLLVGEKNKEAWPKKFAPGSRMYTGLSTAFHYITILDGGGPTASRGQYADFLSEAADVLAKPALTQAADHFRTAGQRWSELTTALLPDHIAPFKETRDLMVREKALFMEQGAASISERQQIKARLNALKAEVSADFPLSEAESGAMREDLRARVLKVHDAEKEAFAVLKSAMG